MAEQFFGAYFHQDWSLDDESWQAVAERFAADAGASTAQHVAASLSALSESPLSDHELAQVVQALGCCYWPGAAAAYRPWLRALAAHLQAAVTDDPPGA